MLGVEFVRDLSTREPAPELASRVRSACFKRGLMIEVGGHFFNVARFLPPLVLTEELARKVSDLGVSVQDLIENFTAAEEVCMMIFRTTPFKVSVLLLAVSLLQIYYYYPRLPDMVASHFGASGQADGWSTKGNFVRMYAVVLCSTVLIFLGICLIIPRVPAAFVNLPNKEYWLAPERKSKTCAVLNEYLLWFNNATILFFMVSMQVTITANLEQTYKLDSWFWIYLGAYLLFTACWCAYLFRRFKRPRSGS